MMHLFFKTTYQLINKNDDTKNNYIFILYSALDQRSGHFFKFMGVGGLSSTINWEMCGFFGGRTAHETRSQYSYKGLIEFDGHL